MTVWRTNNEVTQRISAWQTFLGLLLAVSFLLSVFCAASPELHHCLHGESAQDSDHQCLVSTLAGGQVASAATVLFCHTVPLQTWSELPIAEEHWVPSHLFFLVLPGRAPPLSLVQGSLLG